MVYCNLHCIYNVSGGVGFPVTPEITRPRVALYIAASAKKAHITPALRSNLVQLQQRMAASFTDNPAWIKKMKARFAALDVDKNGVINERDVALLAKKFAG